MYSITLSELAQMGEKEKGEALSRLVKEAKTMNGEGSIETHQIIAAYETRYEMTTDELLAGLEDGSVRETDDIATWLFYISVLNGQARS